MRVILSIQNFNLKYILLKIQIGLNLYLLSNLIVIKFQKLLQVILSFQFKQILKLTYVEKCISGRFSRQMQWSFVHQIFVLHLLLFVVFFVFNLLRTNSNYYLRFSLCFLKLLIVEHFKKVFKSCFFF